YGLDEETELRMLRVARELERRVPVTISTTFLGAHALPPEFENNDDYIDFICETILPKLGKEKLCDAVDVFCEGIGFSLEQSGKVFEKACALGLPIKAHAEQLSDLGGAALVAQYRGLSADHLEYLKAEDVAVLKKANAVAVLLPAAFYFLNEKQVPPIQALRDAKVPMAVATDCNPGSAPIASLLTAMNQSCVLFGLTPEEALTGVTRHAAQALNLANQKGVLEAGKDADLVLWEINHPNELSYGINLTKPSRIWFGGNDVSRS
ncbi:MAG: imidazolonepropionase, partial [Gammaproteobacteria bacterium]|nr:imidazolonepropionase [Gammaproteobacteria bacterium]